VTELDWGPVPKGVTVGFKQPEVGARVYAIGKGSDGGTYLVWAQSGHVPLFARIKLPPLAMMVMDGSSREGWVKWPPPAIEDQGVQ
jgi:hypothetical protein